MSSVEAKDPETQAYFKSLAIDYSDGKVLIQFPNNWKTEWIPQLDVRFVSPAVPADFSPEPGDIVEVLTQSDSDAPYGWWKASIKSCKGEYYFVQFIGWDDTFDDIVELELMRPDSNSLSPDFSKLMRVVIPLPPFLKENATMEDLKSLHNDSQVTILHIDRKEGCVIALGQPAQCRRAQMLAQLSFAHMEELTRKKQNVFKMQNKLSESKNSMSRCVCQEFFVDHAFMGLVIGKKGANITSARAIEGVESITVNQETGHVRVLAKTIELAKSVCGVLDYCEEKVPIPADCIGWVIGKKGRFIRDIERKSGVLHVNIVSESDSTNTNRGARRFKKSSNKPDPSEAQFVRIIGVREAVDNAKILLDMHLKFIDEFNEMENEERALSRAVQELGVGNTFSNPGASRMRRQRGDHHADHAELDETHTHNQVEVSPGCVISRECSPDPVDNQYQISEAQSTPQSNQTHGEGSPAPTTTRRKKTWRSSRRKRAPVNIEQENRCSSPGRGQ